MKKTVLIAVLTFMSMMTISCTTDAIEKDDLRAKDSVKTLNASEQKIFADGPGDDVIPIKP